MIFTLVTEQDRRLPLFVTGVGIQRNQEPIRRPEGLPSFQFAYCARGTGRFQAEGRAYDLPAGTCFLFPPQVPHEYQALEEPWETRWILFDGAQAAGLLSLLHLDRVVVFGTGPLSEIPGLHLEIEAMLERGGQDAILETSATLYRLLLACRRESLAGPDTRDLRPVTRLEPVLACMDARYREELSLADLAACLHVTPAHLCRLFQRAFSLTPVEYLMRVRIRKAKHLLIGEPSLKVGAVARLVGYRDESHFCSLFRRLEHMTPGDFRKRHGMGGASPKSADP